MFKLNNQHSKNLKNSIFTHKNQQGLIKYQQGYSNFDSPMKAAFISQRSPRKNLSPMKLNLQSRLGNNRSRSPILLSKRQDKQASNKKVSPFRRMQFRQTNEKNNQQKPISFTNLIRKNSNASPYQGNNNAQFNKTLQYSTTNYLQSDRNYREDTNLFKKLADMLESNKSNNSFLNSGFDTNSVKYKVMPQSTKNNYSSNKKMYFKDVMTVHSIQSPQEKDFIEESKYYSEFQDVQTKCYSQYEQMTSQITIEKKSSNTSLIQKNEPKMEKKSSKKQCNIQQQEILTFKKISFVNEKTDNQNQKKNAIDYHLTNSFGAAINLKNQIISSQVSPPARKPCINPFEQIVQEPYISQRIQNVVSQQQDSMFASLKMLLSKVDGKQGDIQMNKENESINVSITYENESLDLDMEPYLIKRK